MDGHAYNGKYIIPQGLGAFVAAILILLDVNVLLAAGVGVLVWAVLFVPQTRPGHALARRLGLRLPDLQ